MGFRGTRHFQTHPNAYCCQLDDQSLLGQAPNDLALTESPATHRVEGVARRCELCDVWMEKCWGHGRPSVQNLKKTVVYMIIYDILNGGIMP